MSIVVVILGGALPACQPIPPSYYDWLAAGGGYYDGYAPLYQGRLLNECPLHEVSPRECRVHDPPAMGRSGRGLGASLGALSAHGLVRGSSTGATGHAGAHGGAHASSGGHGGGGHGGHGGR